MVGDKLSFLMFLLVFYNVDSLGAISLTFVTELFSSVKFFLFPHQIEKRFVYLIFSNVILRLNQFAKI